MDSVPHDASAPSLTIVITPLSASRRMRSRVTAVITPVDMSHTSWQRYIQCGNNNTIQNIKVEVHLVRNTERRKTTMDDKIRLHTIKIWILDKSKGTALSYGHFMDWKYCYKLREGTSAYFYVIGHGPHMKRGSCLQSSFLTTIRVIKFTRIAFILKVCYK